MNKQKVFFIGIGGIGMSGLALISKEMGLDIEGSDISENYITEKLKKSGIKVYKGHNPSLITKDISYIVFSSAIKDNNPQIIKAKKLGLKILKRAEFLAHISNGKKLIAVAGTHGKTTTTGMISSILETSKTPYNAIIGGILKHLNTNAVYSCGEYFLIEADESDGTFLHYNPLVSCITNIDTDHLDHYKDLNSIKESFLRFINKVPYYGKVVLCGDDENITSILKFITAPYYTYGFSKNNDWQIKNIDFKKGITSFDLYYLNNKEDKISLQVFGKHNILNAASAYIASRYIGIDRKKIIEGLYLFKGMKRRLDLIKVIGDILFYDDYAHHPSEIKATLSALRNFYSDFNITAIFQPHRYSRTYLLADEFSKSFSDANDVYVDEIYPAGEKNIYKIDKKYIIEKIKKHHKSVNPFESIIDFVKNIKPKTVVVSLGAGDIYKKLNEIIIKYETLLQNNGA